VRVDRHRCLFLTALSSSTCSKARSTRRSETFEKDRVVAIHIAEKGHCRRELSNNKWALVIECPMSSTAAQSSDMAIAIAIAIDIDIDIDVGDELR
jgi:hypothetical protein